MDASPRFPDVTLMITRRVKGRRARMRPGKWLNNAIGFVLAICANHYGLEVIAFCALPNHYHLVVRDPFGQLSNFKRDFHAVFAQLVIKKYDEDEEMLWAPRRGNEVEPLDEEHLIDEIAYVMANPEIHGLVEKHEKRKKNKDPYPGLRMRWPQPARTFERPRGFFRKLAWREDMLTEAGRPKIEWAETATLAFHRPHGFDETDAELEKRIKDAITARKEEAHAKNERLGKTAPRKSLKKMRRRKRSKRKRKCEDFPFEPRYKGPPDLKAERYAALRVWRAQYRAARLEYRTNPEVVFPYGTNQMRERYNVNVAPAPDN